VIFDERFCLLRIFISNLGTFVGGRYFYCVKSLRRLLDEERYINRRRCIHHVYMMYTATPVYISLLVKKPSERFYTVEISSPDEST